MIKRLKRKLIFLCATCLLVLLMLIVVGINLLNYHLVINDTDKILKLLSENKGNFPGFEDDSTPPLEEIPEEPPYKDREPAPAPPKNTAPDETLEGSSENMSAAPDSHKKEDSSKKEMHMSPEVPYETRYFSVLVSKDGQIEQINLSHIISVDEALAEDYTETAFASKHSFDFLGDFRYQKVQEGDNLRITFLDCGRTLDGIYTFLVSSCLIAFLLYAVVLFALCIFAEWIIRPIAESYEKQKRFITDAGHELKTPLSIINTNVDVLQMEYGQNESFTDIYQQTKRLTSLTNQLVSLARMEEAEKPIVVEQLSLSNLIAENAEVFQSTAVAQNKQLNCSNVQDLKVRGDELAVGRLITILLDNAMKYSPAESEIVLTLEKQSRWAVLSITNDCLYPLNNKDLSQIFDRFYRADSSRNSDTGGHGIGLSIAKAIVAAHGGKINAACREKNRFQITVHLPIA